MYVVIRESNPTILRTDDILSVMFSQLSFNALPLPTRGNVLINTSEAFGGKTKKESGVNAVANVYTH